MANFGQIKPTPEKGNWQSPEIPGLLRGRVVLEKGTRKSTPDPETIIKSLGHLLQIWEINRKARMKGNAGSRGDQLRGLFGSGR